MNYETYRLIDDLFVPASGAKDALESAIASHERLRNHLNSAYGGGGQNHVVTPIISAIDRVIQRYKDSNPVGDKYYFVQLSADGLVCIETFDSYDLIRHIDPILSGYRIKCRDYEVDERRSVLEEVISFISWATINSGPDSVGSIILPKLEEIEKEATSRAKELMSTVARHLRLFDKEQLLYAQAAEATAKADVQLTAAGHAFEQKTLEFEDKNKEIDSNIRQLRADLDAQVARFGTEAARKLWGEREKQSRFALIASSIAIFFLIAAPILGAICFTPEVLHYLAQIVAASSLPTMDANGQVLPAPNDTQITIAAIGRLVIVTLPVFLYIWAIRLVVRFNSRSLMLLDDARLRLTMLDTFFHLIEKEGAVKEDRALVLNALFRPGPGHGDNVDPPNFTELVTKAMGSTPSK